MENHCKNTQIEKPYTIVNNMRMFDYQKTVKYLEAYGKHKFGNKFRIYHEDLKIIHMLICYMAYIEDGCKKHGIDPNKGLLLTGPIGCGKTSWMHVIQVIGLHFQRFQIKSTRDIAFEFNKDGYDTINTYGRAKRIICFDDLGVEQNIKFYGNECNTMAEILLHRYELLVQQKIITHATTNLSATELEELYGNRVRSRLREMFNLISFPSNAKDKRT